MLTEEEYIELCKYECNFYTAINQSYMCGVLKKDFDTVLRIYRRVTGDMYNHTIGCGSCVLSLYVKCGKVFYKHRDEIINNNK